MSNLFDSDRDDAQDNRFPIDVDYVGGARWRSHPQNNDETAESVHDFRNILGTISSLAETVLLELEPAGPIHAMLTGIRDACVDGGILCCRMLDNACNAAFDEESFDLSSVASGMAAQIRATLPAAATLRFELTDSAPVEAPAPGRIRQVLLNLVRNAAESLADRSGTVTVSTGVTTLDALCGDNTSRRSAKPVAIYSFLAVADSGARMSEAERDKLLNQPFAAMPGADGRGMASVRRIVHGCGGTIQILSQAGHGAQIRVLFPQEQPLDTADPLCTRDVPVESDERARARRLADETSASRLIRSSLPRTLTLVGHLQLEE
jgi:signal transduction histidine kinase